MIRERNRELQEVMKKLNYYMGKVDGDWGKKSKHAYTAMMYDINYGKAVLVIEEREVGGEPFVLPDGSIPKIARVEGWTNLEMQAYFGAVGTGAIKLTIPYPMRLAWDTSIVVKTIMVHNKVAKPLNTALYQVLDYYGLDTIQAMGLDLFGGVLNVRRKRGGSQWSSHAYAASIDLNPKGNPFRANPLETTFADPAYTEFARIMVANGFQTLEYDLMHWQYKIN